MRHPLFASDDVSFEEELARANPPIHIVGKLRQARQGNLSDVERQTALALWRSVIRSPEGFRWPWPTLDNVTGILPAGDMAVVLAQTGSGKTTFTTSLLNRLTSDLLTGQRCLAFATEIPADRYRSQLASRRAGLHPDKVELGDWSHAGWRMTDSEARSAYQVAVNDIERHNLLTIAPHLRLKASELRDTLQREADRSQPQVVVVDHFQAIHHDLYEGVNAVQATLAILQDFAVREHIAVVVTNQVHVRGQGGLPPRPTDCVSLAGVFGGQALGQAASQILGVHRKFLNLTNTGAAITPAFLKEFRKGGGNESELWDRTTVAIDLPKLRYDAHGNIGKEVTLAYKDGQYTEMEEA